MITEYLRWLRPAFTKPYKVYPVQKAEDSAYELPEPPKKGKRDLPRKAQNSKKFPEENFTSKGTILSIWV